MLAIPLTSAPVSPRPVAPARASGERPLRVLLHGVEGVGASTFAANAPAPVFVCTEDGAAQLDVARFPAPRTWVDVLEAIRVLTYDEHEHRTLVLDGLEGLESLCQKHVCMMAGVGHLDEIAYGRGYAEAVDQWRKLFGKLEGLVQARRMNVILLGHTTSKRIETETGLHDRNQLKVHDRVTELLRGWCDAILFARRERVSVGRTRLRAPEARLIHTDESPRWEARNRFDLPALLPLDWDEFVSAVRAYKPSDVMALRAQLVALMPYLQEAARAAQVMRDWAGDDPVKLLQLLDRVRSKLTLEAAGEPTT